MNDLSIESSHDSVYGFLEPQFMHNAKDRHDQYQGYITR